MENRKFKIDINYLEMLYDMIGSTGCEEFEEDLTTLERFIHRMKHDFNDDTQYRNSIAAYRENIGYYNTYKQYYKYVRSLLKTDLKFYDVVHPNYKVMNIGDRESLDIAVDFFKSQNKFFSDGIEEYLEDDVYEHLEFINPNEKTDGEMHFIESTGDAFVIAPDHKNITKISILIHELEHVIDSFTNPKFFKNRIIRECGSMFMELIGTDYIRSVLDVELNPEMRRFYIHSIMKMDANYLLHKNQLLYLGDKYKEFNSGNLKKIIQRYGYTLYDITRLNETCLVHDYYYQVSYLIAVELYNLYKKDKDNALFLLEFIIRNGNDNNIFKILDSFGIKLTQGLNQYEEELCLKLGI